MSRNYKCLSEFKFQNGNYSLVAIRDKDKYAIMEWRNEQIDILRQKELLTKKEQENYFATVVSDLFEQEKPQQLLFSFLEDNILIGYGGLVHIDWKNKNAEISFITETKRNIEIDQFINDWDCYLKILKEIAKEELHFTKIYTYAYDLRPHLYDALLKSDFIEETRLKDHVVINNKNYDVLIHACFLNQLVFRMASENDVMQYFEWANDEDVRKNSFSEEKISLEHHKEWFTQKLKTNNCFLYLFLLNDEPVGQVRIEDVDGENSIDISIDKKQRGKKLGVQMLRLATSSFFENASVSNVYSYIKKDNVSSLITFKKVGFEIVSSIHVKGVPTYKLLLNA
jgi:RimJ/RimL family protein N-acetyltransferase